ncbi:MAG TPA: helix-turn-helix domain-containing protein [Candidatus Blautia faecipullorum]|nr:helix-turn-helix domain-containing protein [Candidatus Blautia faecipullorum]
MITDLKAFCRLFYLSTAIPVSCCHYPTGDITSYPTVPGDKALYKSIPSDIIHLNKNPDYFISQSFGYFGYINVKSMESGITIGPVFSTPVSGQAIHSFMLEWAINGEHKETITHFLSHIPLLSFDQFLHMVAYLHLCLNDEQINIGQHFGLDNTSAIHEFSNLHSDQVINAKETQRFHNTYEFERQLSQYIQNGDLKSLKQLLKTTADLSGGIMADNSLRQEKNLFISTAAIVTRSAIAGGMDMEQAYMLSDIYIQECERSQDIAHISTLNYTMLIDFTERVAQNKIPQGMSPEIFQCIQFITHHVNEPIQVGDVAEHIGRSRSYLTGKFKKELGFDVSSFIMRCRLEEAKSLLTYSNKSLSEISNYLCFSSQSYFQNVFKKKYGVTPLQYRNNTHKI